MEQELTVKLYAPFSDFAGARLVALQVSKPLSAKGLLNELAARYPALAPHFDEDRSSDEAVLVVVNGKLAEAQDAVKPGDDVFICPQITGG
ncbi:MAG: MoaD/ThiS family protein [Chloroflexi bacterium]|nr:MoaD/ThiS family protein [Chloroflexota bacterium]MCL5107290.1 MoaD/ThiS family protein [Chloroflexota bacterium]